MFQLICEWRSSSFCFHWKREFLSLITCSSFITDPWEEKVLKQLDDAAHLWNPYPVFMSSATQSHPASCVLIDFSWWPCGSAELFTETNQHILILLTAAYCSLCNLPRSHCRGVCVTGHFSSSGCRWKQHNTHCVVSFQIHNEGCSQEICSVQVQMRENIRM